jgi:hypothetical protein
MKWNDLIMSLHARLSQAISDRNMAAYQELLHDDLEVIFHKSGGSYSKDEWVPMVSGMMSNEKFIQESPRCVYENDDILVHHSFMAYPDETREAVMHVAILKDGKIIRIETGATPLD